MTPMLSLDDKKQLLDRRKRAKESWTLDLGVEFVRKLSQHLRAVDYEVALAGSVLRKGESTKDVDVVIFPRSTAVGSLSQVYAALWDFGLFRLWDRAEIAVEWKKQGSLDTKHVEVWAWNDRRVDIFFLR